MEIKNTDYRIASLRRTMASEKLDAIVCRLNNNVVMLSGYWPMNGLSLAILPLESDPVLIIPEQDKRFAQDCFVPDIRTYRWGSTKHMDPLAGLQKLAAEICTERGLSGKRIGMESDYSLASLPVWGAEMRQFTQSNLLFIQSAFPRAKFIDSWALLSRCASCKTPLEIKKIQRANQLGNLALDTFREAVRSGRRECEIAADVERVVHAKGPGTDGIKFVRAWANVMSGDNSSLACQTYNISTSRMIHKGDLVLLELGLVADGYWTDLTRVHVAGKPSAIQKETFDLVKQAHDDAAAAVKPGASWRVIDQAARKIITKAGQGKNFPHITGHGVGFCYHETHPLIAPKIDHAIEVGQVVAIEPGIYRSGFGGIRHENNYLVTPLGVENLSPFYCGLET